MLSVHSSSAMSRTSVNLANEAFREPPQRVRVMISQAGVMIDFMSQSRKIAANHAAAT